ncbi:quinone-dependent dihydroorotate dehydrogenase [soil metagenome]
MGLYRGLFNQFLTKTDAERAHRHAFAAIRAAEPVLVRRSVPGAPVQAMGLTFPNALGLAAGFDKNAVGVDALGGLGFGHVEIGTVTALAQPGNSQPRLFRLVADRAVVNRMGFNNDGAEAVARRLLARQQARSPASGRLRPSQRKGPVLGVNIGKSKAVPDDDQAAVEADYATSTRLLSPYADYLVVNVSSPNTPGLRNLQAVDRLQPLLARVRTTAEKYADRPVPLLVKIAPDLDDQDIVEVVEMAVSVGLDGIIATNTTTSRDGLRAHPAEIEEIGAGGLSGAPLKDRALAVLRLVKATAGDSLTLIGVGGITTVADAQARLDAGATLVQGYTGFIYEGPNWPRRIAKGISP